MEFTEDTGMNICRVVGEFPFKEQIVPGLGPATGYLGPDVYRLSLAQLELNENVDVICRGPPREELIDGIRVHRLGTPYNVRAPLMIRQLDQDRHIDIVHMHATNSFAYAVLREAICKKPLVAHAHGTTAAAMRIPDANANLPHGIAHALGAGFSMVREKIVWRGAEKVVAVSRATTHEISKYYGIPQDKLAVVYNGTNLDVFRPSRSQGEAKGEIGVSGRKVVLCVAQLGPRKGIHNLIKASPKVIGRFRDVIFLLAGGVPTYQEEATLRYVEWLKELSRNLGVSKNFRFLGPVPHSRIARFHMAADVFVLPSLYEGFPKAILEAMACGTPIVSTHVGGIPEMVKDGLHGFLVRPGHPGELSDAILRVLSDPSLAEGMGSDSRSHVEKHFTWQNAAHKLRNIYEEVLKNY